MGFYYPASGEHITVACQNLVTQQKKWGGTWSMTFNGLHIHATGSEEPDDLVAFYRCWREEEDQKSADRLAKTVAEVEAQKADPKPVDPPPPIQCPGPGRRQGLIWTNHGRELFVVCAKHDSDRWWVIQADQVPWNAPWYDFKEHVTDAWFKGAEIVVRPGQVYAAEGYGRVHVVHGRASKYDLEDRQGEVQPHRERVRWSVNMVRQKMKSGVLCSLLYDEGPPREAYLPSALTVDVQHEDYV